MCVTSDVRCKIRDAAQPAPVQPVDGTQVSKVWWDGEKLMTKPIPLEDFYQPVHEAVAWEDGPHLVVRSDMRERLNYKGPWVDMGRAIPDAWVPVLYTTPPAQPAPVQEPVAQSLKDAVFTVLEGFTLPHDVRKILEAAYYTPPAAPTVQEPVAWINAKDGMTYLHGPYNSDDRPLIYGDTAPPAAQLPVPLTDEQSRKGFREQDDQWTFKGMTAWQVWQKAIAWHEADLGIKVKNT
jgi:hypothetical protein